jgi:hypothetical protein
LYVAPTDPPVIEMNDEYRFFTLNAPDASYEGVHTVTIEVTLFNYKNFNSPFQESFDVYVAPSCNSTEFITYQAPVVDFEELGLG